MYNGVIIVNKEKGFTSHDVVAKLRGILKQKKIGHTGTLDPDATGVLPVCLGCATKLCDMLTDKDKTYEAVMLLGQATDTQDTTGQVTDSVDVEAMRAQGKLDDEAILEAIRSFVGPYSQIPPMYSALKVNGKKLYELAREGIEVERKPREVFIHAIEDIEIDFPRVRMTVSCSKGTYIRTLCHDIGLKLGTFACIDGLKRTQVSAFTLSQAKTLDDISELVAAGKVDEHIIPVESVFTEYRAAKTEPEFDKLIYNGNSLHKHTVSMVSEEPSDGEKFRIYDSKGTFMGIFVYNVQEHIFRCEKMFFS